MKIKAILAALVGAVAIQGATAGTWAPPAPAKCPIDDCPDIGGNIAVGYDTDYVFKGVRLARDVLWGDVNYTFDNLPFTPNIGVFHLTDLNNAVGQSFGGPPFFIPNGTSNYGDETRIYSSIALPSILGFDAGVGYTHYFFPTLRGPSPGGPFGDSLSEVTATLARELIWGVVGSYQADYRWGSGFGGWLHTFGLAKGFDISDAIGLNLSGGVRYNDNYWKNFPGFGLNNFIPGNSHNWPLGNYGRDSDWHSYFIRAALPIALNCRATLTPYIEYNGTPDGWSGDGMYGTYGGGFPIVPAYPLGGNANRNDVFFGGVSLNVDF